MIQDVGRLLALPARLLWRHWPVLITAATLGLVGRELVLWAAAGVAKRNAGLAVLVGLLAPLVVLVALVVMVRAMHASLRDELKQEKTPVLRYTGSLLIPFVVLYLALGLADRGPASPVRTRYVAAAVAGVFAVRWLMSRWNRGPVFAYLESVWITLGLLYVVRPVFGFVAQRLPYADKVFFVPLAGLLVACVATGVRRPTVRKGPRRHRWLTGDAATPRFGPLVDAVRAVARTPVPVLMALCLVTAAAQTLVPWGRLGVVRLIGPYEPDSVTAAFQPSVELAARVVALVLLAALVAAGAERVAVAAAKPRATNGTVPMPSTPPPQWPMPQPEWPGGTMAPPVWPGQPPPQPAQSVAR